MKYLVLRGEDERRLVLTPDGDSHVARWDGLECCFKIHDLGRGRSRLECEGQSYLVDVLGQESSSFETMIEGKVFGFSLLNTQEEALRDSGVGLESEEQSGGVIAPMPGKVVAVLVKPGDHVEPGQGLIVVEAMKMENELRAPIAGRVKDVKVCSGDAVESGALLVQIEA